MWFVQRVHPSENPDCHSRFLFLCRRKPGDHCDRWTERLSFAERFHERSAAAQRLASVSTSGAYLAECTDTGCIVWRWRRFAPDN